MIERQTIDGREAVVIYLSDDLTPVDRDEASLVKVTFEDDNSSVWLVPPGREDGLEIGEDEFNEKDHPRREDGKFGSGAGSGAAVGPEARAPNDRDEDDKLLADLPPGAGFVEGKGQLGRGKFMVVAGNISSNLHATKEEAVKEAKQWLKNRELTDRKKAEDNVRRAKLAEHLLSGSQEISDTDLKFLDLRPTTEMRFLMPAAAQLFGLKSRDVRPYVANMIRIGYTEFGAKKEYISSRPALLKIAHALANKSAPGAAFDAAWNEGDHPRGQPGNAGQFGPGGGSSGGAAKPQKTKAEFQQHVAKQKAAREKLKSRIEKSLTDEGSFEVETGNGRTWMLTPATSRDTEPYRITFFDKDGDPTGHIEIRDIDEAARELSGWVKPERKLATASQLYQPPTKTADEIVAEFPGGAEAIQKTRERLAKVVPTDKQFKLEDGTYTPERQAVHKKIIDHILTPEAIARSMPAAGEKPVLTMLGGRGGSGKSWLTKSENAPVNENTSLLLDVDEIKSLLGELGGDPPYEGWNAAQFHEESGDVVDIIDRMCTKLGVNVIHDATLKSEGSAGQRMAAYVASGYEVEGYYMYLSPQDATKRALGRYSKGGTFTGRFVPPEIVLGNTQNEKNFDKLSANMRKWAVYDNSGKAPQLVSRSDGDE